MTNDGDRRGKIFSCCRRDIRVTEGKGSNTVADDNNKKNDARRSTIISIEERMKEKVEEEQEQEDSRGIESNIQKSLTAIMTSISISTSTTVANTDANTNTNVDAGC